jgi:plasmid maintenance system antidote protein VapI
MPRRPAKHAPNLGAVVAAELVARGLSHERAAAAAGIERNSLRSILKGGRPRVDTWARLAAALGISPARSGELLAECFPLTTPPPE